MPRQTLKQRPDGRYACKYKGKFFYGSTQSEALAAREAYKRNEKVGLVEKPVTLIEYAAQWLPVHRASVSQKTYNDYAKQIEKMCRLIGEKLLSTVTPSDIKRVFSAYLGYSDSTIRRSSVLFTALFESAVADGYILRNPCKHETARPHKGTVGTHRAITDDERALILSTPHRVRLAALVMLYAGLRRGEALAIDIDRDVDLKTNQIHVHTAVRFDSNQPILDTPKTEAGERDVPLVALLRDELSGQHGLLLPSAHGKMCSDTAFRRAWNSYMHALSVAAGHSVSIRPHDLRHSYCTMLRDAGIDLKIAMMWMGHADKDMILRVYDHVTPTRMFRSVASLERFCASSSQNGSQIDEINIKSL